MAKKLKDIYTEEVIEEMSKNFKIIYEKFDENKFLGLIKENNKKKWEELELKERFTRLAISFYESCNCSFSEISKILIEINEKCKGFKYLFLPEIVEIYGVNNLELSLKTLEVLTTGSTAEFAIRKFLKLNFEKTFRQMKEWAKSENEHHRRLASEGIRIKLPWGKKVEKLYEYPEQIIEILEILNEDDSLYVRKSVANNINDLSKEFPDLVMKTLKKWERKNNEKTNWIIKNGARTLIKNGDKKMLEILNYKSEEIKIFSSNLEVDKNNLRLNEETNFKYSVNVQTMKKINVRLALQFEFLRSNKKYSKKIFFLKDVTVENEKKIEGSKKYTWKNMTTRKHYSGIQKIKLLLNEKMLNEVEIVLNTN